MKKPRIRGAFLCLDGVGRYTAGRYTAGREGIEKDAGMLSWLLKLIRDRVADDVWQLVVAGTGLTSIVSYVYTQFADYNIPINSPLLAVSGMAVLVASVLWMLQRRKRPEWMKYTDDSFEGVNWRWQYSKEREVINLTARCPRCGRVLELHECKGLLGVRYFCTGCVADRDSGIVATQPKYIDEQVLQLIEDKLYNIRRGAIPIPGFPGS